MLWQRGAEAGWEELSHPRLGGLAQGGQRQDRQARPDRKLYRQGEEGKHSPLCHGFYAIAPPPPDPPPSFWHTLFEL